MPHSPPVDPASLKGDELTRFLGNEHTFFPESQRFHQWGQFTTVGTVLGAGAQTHLIDLFVIPEGAFVTTVHCISPQFATTVTTLDVGTSDDDDAFYEALDLDAGAINTWNSVTTLGVGLGVLAAPVWMRLTLDYATLTPADDLVIQVYAEWIVVPSFA